MENDDMRNDDAEWNQIQYTPRYSLDPLRTLLSDAQQATTTMQQFSVEPYLYLSMLAYAKPNERLQMFRNRFQFFSDDNEEKRFAVSPAECPGFASETMIIVFRGTVLSDIADLRSDRSLLFGQQKYSLADDPRFQNEVNEVDVLAEHFLSIQPEGRIILTGHSLGGTIAYEIAKAFPDFDVITFNMGSFANRVVQHNMIMQQRSGVGLHIRAHNDKLSSNPGDDGSFRNILVTVRLPDSPGLNLFPYHGVEFMYQNIGQIDEAILRRLGYQEGGRRRRRKARTKLRKSATSKRPHKARKPRKPSLKRTKNKARTVSKLRRK